MACDGVCVQFCRTCNVLQIVIKAFEHLKSTEEMKYSRLQFAARNIRKHGRIGKE